MGVERVAELARRIATQPSMGLKLAKQAVNRAFEAPLADGVRFERLIFHSLFGTADQREGMAAFLDKRKPAFVQG